MCGPLTGFSQAIISPDGNSKIFGNLLDNAIETCDKIFEGEKTIDIKIKYHQKQNFVSRKMVFYVKKYVDLYS
uniref:GHKL domain-containing protein n=1 Tax=Paenibacillus sp. FSL H7-0442 TaxID=2921435 RepID=UPI00406D2A13